MAGVGREPSSWGEMLQQHKAKQTSCPWKPEEVRVKHVTRYEKSREERHFDPILQYYRDPKRDEMSRTRTKQETLYKLNRARDKQLRYTQTFDIITHVPKVKEPAGSLPKWPKPAPPDTRQTHNIITNINFDKHHFAKPGERPDVRPPTVRQPPGCTVKGRDYNIISNKYILNHDDKDAIDKEMSRVVAAEKYWQTRDFNPLTCSFYDERKESDYKQREESKQQSHGKQYNERFPATIRRSEGVCYDVITMSVKDKEAMAKREAENNKVINSRIANEVEQRVRVRGEAIAKAEEERSLARVSAKRFAEATRHGYDIVTNQRFNGVDARPVFPNRGSLSTTVWQRIEAEARSGSQAPPALRRAATAASMQRSATPASRLPPRHNAEVEVIQHSARPQSVPGSMRTGASVRSGGFAWTQNADGGGGGTSGGGRPPSGAGAAGSQRAASRGSAARGGSRASSRPPVPRLTLRSSSSAQQVKPAASPISTGGNIGGLAPASGGVRTGGFR